jgi:hypothetical protein
MLDITTISAESDLIDQELKVQLSDILKKMEDPVKLWPMCFSRNSGRERNQFLYFGYL